MSILELGSIITAKSFITRIEVNSKGTAIEGTRFDPGPHESWEWQCKICQEMCTNLTLEEAQVADAEHVCPKEVA